MSLSAASTTRTFAEAFGSPPGVVGVAPGRVNLIGEHTDYNDGFVLPMAIERATVVAARRRDDGLVRLRSENLGQSAEVRLDDGPARQPEHSWADYVLAVWALWEAGARELPGADVLVTGDVPIGCGLSSSASLTMAALKALEAMSGQALDGAAAAVLGQRAENEFLGVSCGIMDPFVIRNAREGHALLLDCRSHSFEHIPADLPDAAFLVVNSGVSRGLAGSKYNERVGECGEAVKILQQSTGKPGTHLRDYSADDLDSAREAMDTAVFRRARHVISENARTLSAAEALREGDAATMGRLMRASHESLRDDYEVSCAELDALCAIGDGHPACLGARMTGAGFGGCTVHLVRREEVDAYTAHLETAYREATGLAAEVIVSGAAAGAHILPA